MKISVVSYMAEFNDNALISLYEHDDDSILELIYNGKICSASLNEFNVEDLKEIKDFINNVIIKKSDKK